MVIGTPCSRPNSAPFAFALSAAFAALRASSDRSTTTALSFGLTERIRWIWVSVTSSDEIAPERIAAAVSDADHCQIGPLGRRILARRGAAFLAALAFASLLWLFLAKLFGAVLFEMLFFLMTVFLATPTSKS